MKLAYLPEPELEFGGNGRHIDIRFGLTRYGPLDVASESAPKKIKVGLVGTPHNVEAISAWLERCRNEIPAKRSRQPNLFPSFPGFNEDVAFQSTLVLNPEVTRTISPSVFDEIVSSSHNTAVSAAVELYLTEFDALREKRSVDVLICAVPPQLVALREPEDDSRSGGNRHDFHHMLKARAMRTQLPVQLVLPQTYDATSRRRQKIRSTRLRTQQDEATRAWNFHTALYYKAHGYPWRLTRDASQLDTCFIGISFYRSLDQTTLMTSMAQVFNEKGDGLIVRGDPVRPLNKADLVPHLDAAGAHRLLTDALQRYRSEHFNWPARVVLHKTSPFNADELDGFQAAATQQTIARFDAISLSDSTPVRLFRVGAYPPLRGTHMQLDPRLHVVYMRGSVDFFQTYPGGYIPSPVMFRCDQTEQTPTFLAREMLALSKMNWNDTQFDGRLPITVAAARKVSGILKYVGPSDPLAHRYSHYM